MMSGHGTYPIFFNKKANTGRSEHLLNPTPHILEVLFFALAPPPPPRTHLILDVICALHLIFINDMYTITITRVRRILEIILSNILLFFYLTWNTFERKYYGHSPFPLA